MIDDEGATSSSMATTETTANMKNKLLSHAQSKATQLACNQNNNIGEINTICNAINILAKNEYTNSLEFDVHLFDMLKRFVWASSNNRKIVYIFVASHEKDEMEMSELDGGGGGGRRVEAFPIAAYVMFLYGIYRRYVHSGGIYSTKIVLESTKTLFSRVILDVDVKNNSNNDDDTQRHVFQTLKPIMTKLGTHTITKRTNTSTSNFHMVFDTQVDAVSNLSLQRMIASINMANVKIDPLENFFFPTGRSHRPIATGRRLMDFDTFMKIAPLDVENEQNFYTLLNKIPSMGSEFLLAQEKPKHTMQCTYMGDENPATATATTINSEYMVKMHLNNGVFDQTKIEKRLFFTQFHNVSSMQIMQHDEIRCSWDRREILNFFMRCNANSGGGGGDGVDNEDRFGNLSDEELEAIRMQSSLNTNDFFKIYFTSGIKYEKTPLEICEKINLELAKDADVSAMKNNICEMVQVERGETFKDQYSEYLNFIKTHYVPKEDEETNKMVNEATSQINVDDNLDDFLAFLVEEERGHFIYGFFVAFFANNYLFRKIMLNGAYINAEDVAPFLYGFFFHLARKSHLKHKPDEIQKKWGLSEDDTFYNRGRFFEQTQHIVKPILRLFLVHMLNSGYIMDTIAIVMKLKWKSVPFCSAILFCLALNGQRNLLEDHVKHKLGWYLKPHFEPYMKCINLNSIYLINPMIYVASGLFNVSHEMARGWFSHNVDTYIQPSNEQQNPDDEQQPNDDASSPPPSTSSTCAPPASKRRKKNPAAPKPKREENKKYSPEYVMFVMTMKWKYMACLLENGGMFFIYSENRYIEIEDNASRMEKSPKMKSLPCTQMKIEPAKYNYWYRRKYGIFCSITQTFDHHSPGPQSLIYIENSPLLLPNTTYHKLTFPTNWFKKNFMLEVFLKARHYIKFLRHNTTLAILLNTIERPSDSNLPEKYKFVQITPLDFNKIEFDPLTPTINMASTHEYPNFFHCFKRMYILICSLSHRCDINLENISRFIQTFHIVMGQTTIQHPASQPPHASASSSSSQNDCTTNANVNLFGQTVRKSKKFIEYVREKMMQQFGGGGGGDDDDDEMDNETTPRDKDVYSFDLTHDTFSTTKNYQTLDEFTLCDYMNGKFSDLENYSMDVDTMHETLFKFVFCATSWLLRYTNSNNKHTSPKLFKDILPVKRQAYKELAQMCHTAYGDFIVNRDIRHIKRYFESFCKGTSLVEPDDDYVKHENYTICNYCQLTEEELLPLAQQYNRFETPESLHSFIQDIYSGMSSFIREGQYNSDTLFDYLKFLVGCTHRGNITRTAFLMFKFPATGKNQFMEQAIALFLTKNQTFTYKQFKNDEKQTGNDMIKPLCQNLLITVDEYKKFTDSLKVFVNVSQVLQQRRMFQQDNSQFRINANILLSTNEFPTGVTPANLSRLDCVPRFSQLAEETTENIARTHSIHNTVVGEVLINRWFATQDLMGKTPKDKSQHLEFLGVYLFVWNFIDLLYNNPTEPISSFRSPKMNQDHKNILYEVQPSTYLIDNKIVEESPNVSIKSKEFEIELMNKINSLRSLWSSDVKPDQIKTEILDRFQNYICGEDYYIKIN